MKNRGKKEKKKEPRGGRKNRSAAIVPRGWIRNSAIPWPSTKGLRNLNDSP